jgi:hypothetical protein
VPAKLSDIKRAVTALGFTLEPPKRGSHWKVRRGGRSYPIPAHNGLKEEIQDPYIRGLCRFLGIELEEFRKRL